MRSAAVAAVELPVRNDWEILAPPPVTIFCGE